jgi:hypothetical protein
MQSPVFMKTGILVCISWHLSPSQLHVYKFHQLCMYPLIFVCSGFVKMLTAATNTRTIELLGMLFSMQPMPNHMKGDGSS